MTAPIFKRAVIQLHRNTEPPELHVVDARCLTDVAVNDYRPIKRHTRGNEFCPRELRCEVNVADAVSQRQEVDVPRSRHVASARGIMASGGSVVIFRRARIDDRQIPVLEVSMDIRSIRNPVAVRHNMKTTTRNSLRGRLDSTARSFPGIVSTVQYVRAVAKPEIVQFHVCTRNGMLPPRCAGHDDDALVRHTAPFQNVPE